MLRRHLGLALLLIAALCVNVFAGERNLREPIVKPALEARRTTSITRALDENIFFEDWESGGFAQWTARDLTSQPSTWHLDDWNAYGGTGTSWWMGDTSLVGGQPLNGYLDDWYMVLDSPPITLPATTPTLRFWHRYRVEDPGGEPAGYNGWDGMNLRISTNNGQTWAIVPSNVLTPPYDRTSLYSFGFQHGEGLNIPGWCGMNVGNTWHLQTANLTQWAGQTVKLRFAFASDPGWSTPQDRTAYGWQVDALRVYSGTDTVFTDDCNAIGNWTHTAVGDVGGNFWRTATDATSPNGPTILVCNSAATGNYGPNMNNVIESPYIDLRNLGMGTLIADVQLTGTVMGEGFPNSDYWGMEVSIDSGFSWCRVSNPTCDPGGTNYVYTDCPDFWASFNESYGDDMDFSALIGNVLKFRFGMESNADANVAVGPKFDGFTVDHSAGFPNDITCYALQVRYPNIANRPYRIRAYFRNVGSNDQNNVQTWWRVIGQNPRPFIGTFPLISGASQIRDTLVSITTAGTYSMAAWSVVGADDNLQNDTTTAAAIVVQSVGSSPEIGYDDRGVVYRFNYETGRGPLVHFTPWSDGLVTEPYDILQVKIQYTASQPGDLPIRYHIYADNNGNPGTELYNELITVLASETAPNWKTVNVATDPDLADLAGNFWFWLEVVATGSGDRYPQVLGDDEKPWQDRHFYTWDGQGTRSNAQYFYQIHAVLDHVTRAREVSAEIPAAWSLEQNYPNPFNPATEIRYSVPKAEHVTLKVYNMLGQEVATLVNDVSPAGTFAVTFNGHSLSSGLYIYRLESASFTAAHKMLLMK